MELTAALADAFALLDDALKAEAFESLANPYIQMVRQDPESAYGVQKNNEGVRAADTALAEEVRRERWQDIASCMPAIAAGFRRAFTAPGFKGSVREAHRGASFPSPFGCGDESRRIGIINPRGAKLELLQDLSPRAFALTIDPKRPGLNSFYAVFPGVLHEPFNAGSYSVLSLARTGRVECTLFRFSIPGNDVLNMALGFTEETRYNGMENRRVSPLAVPWLSGNDPYGHLLHALEAVPEQLALWCK